ncbi:MAG TPA: hypothetical protein VKH35_09240 [Thermoanaerobaculia bacterium]|nr:hypothetical protein [Thermoanaerobaculia bacterium]
MNRQYFETVIEDNRQQDADLRQRAHEMAVLIGENRTLSAEKAKDDVHIDWLRHRVNALEKMTAVLMQKAAGVSLPVPEIVPTRPGSMTVPNFDYMPSFEDVGEEEARRLGIEHDDSGELVYKK